MVFSNMSYAFKNHTNETAEKVFEILVNLEKKDQKEGESS